MSSTPRTPLFRKLWKPAALTGAAGTAAVFWLEEFFLYIEEILALIFLPLLAGVIYLFNVYVFKSHLPEHEERGKVQDIREKR